MSRLRYSFYNTRKRDQLVGQVFNAIPNNDLKTAKAAAAQIIDKFGFDEISPRSLLRAIDQFPGNVTRTEFSLFIAMKTQDAMDRFCEDWKNTNNGFTQRGIASLILLYDISMDKARENMEKIENHDSQIRLQERINGMLAAEKVNVAPKTQLAKSLFRPPNTEL